MKHLKYIEVTLFLLFVDIATKLLVLQSPFKEFFNPKINTGALFGLGQNQNLFFILVSIVFILYILSIFDREIRLHVPFAFILAGALGNLLDRMIYNGVIDFIDLKFWPVFNLADVFIVGGIIWALIIVLKKETKRKK